MTEPKFTILETISEGPTTTVYKAVQNVLGRTVLLKVLHKHLLQDRELAERFRREATACAMLRSEHIVQVYNLDEVEGAPAIVMEYVEGESLKDYLARTGDRSEAFARTVAASVLKGLVAAHRQGIIHRDIKPGNIMVTPDGTVRITDFGLASLLASPSLTVEGVLVGTPAYMSPEQALGESLDVRTDLFSLGATLVEIIGGNQLFSSTSYAECINKITHFKAESLDVLIGSASPEFTEFLKRLMRPARAERFPGAEEALSSLTGSPLPERTRAKGPQVRTRVLTLAALLVVVIAGYYLVADRPGPTLTTSGLPDSGAVAGDSLTDSGANTALENRIESPDSRQSSPRAVPGPVSQADSASTLWSPGDSGYVSITCNPWGKVYLDEQYVGTTPIAGSIRVAAGSHTIAFNNPQFAPIIRTIAVRKNEDLPVEADFLKASGYLLFNVSPWAEIFVDDQYRETTPLSTPLVVSSGTRKIRLSHPSFSDHVLEVGVSAGDTVRVSHDFQRTKHE